MIGPMTIDVGAGRVAALVTIAVTIGVAVGQLMALFTAPFAQARPSDPGVVSYAILGKGSVGNVVGGPMRDESLFTQPFQGYFVDNPVCNNWADIGLPDVYNDPDLASFNGASTQTAPNDQTHFVKQAVGVFAAANAANAAFHRVVDRTVGCAGQTTAMHLENGTTQVWTFDGGAPGPADASWSKQEGGTDRRCFIQTRLRENVVLQAKVCQSGNGGPAVNVLAGAMENALGQ
jgi:PknH-like extracellular domain